MKILDEAFEILQSEYLWWGVTDYWHASVCVFHCELGGEERPSETENSRSMSSSVWMKNFTEFEATLPVEKHRSAFVSNYTKYVKDRFPGEILFYQDMIIPEFYRRALLCGCGGLLPSWLDRQRQLEAYRFDSLLVKSWIWWQRDVHRKLTTSTLLFCLRW